MIEKIPTGIVAISDHEVVRRFNEIIDYLEKKFPEDFKPKIELLPCPFCGKNVQFVGTSGEIDGDSDNKDSFAVCCSFNSGGCGATSGYRETKEEAIKAWNMRGDDGEID